MKNYNNNSLMLMPISEEEIGKFNKMGDIYILYTTMFSNNIEIGFIDNYLSVFSPTLSNTTYLEYANGKAYFYDLDSSYEKYDNDENRPIYEVVPSRNNTVESYKIIIGDNSLEVFINTQQSKKTLVKTKNS